MLRTQRHRVRPRRIHSRSCSALTRRPHPVRILFTRLATHLFRALPSHRVVDCRARSTGWAPAAVSEMLSRRRDGSTRCVSAHAFVADVHRAARPYRPFRRGGPAVRSATTDGKEFFTCPPRRYVLSVRTRCRSASRRDSTRSSIVRAVEANWRSWRWVRRCSPVHPRSKRTGESNGRARARGIHRNVVAVMCTAAVGPFRPAFHPNPGELETP